MPQLKSTDSYRGRFAPSPTGPLHMGSLVCALASYLDARKNRGAWLLRIEDIDPPREQAGASAAIINCLEKHSLYWDGAITYQSKHSQRYLEILETLQDRQLIYPCICTRKRLQRLSLRYDGECLLRSQPPQNDSTPYAMRLNTQKACSNLSQEAIHTTCRVSFNDKIQGLQHEDFELSGDFIVHRKDKLFAYQLAVAVDDLDQNITHVVRGADLLDTTAKQILIMQTLGASHPQYSHIPVLVDHLGRKLSKQNHAPAIDTSQPKSNLIKACKLLGLPAEQTLLDEDAANILTWATQHWHSKALRQKKQLIEHLT